jgi:hypothetical protein
VVAFAISSMEPGSGLSGATLDACAKIAAGASPNATRTNENLPIARTHHLRQSIRERCEV